MTVNQWAEVIDNPRQRNTAAHALKASKKHLKIASPAHARVCAARLPGGDLIKLDGHTRSLLWTSGALTAPPVVYVDLIAVKSIQEAKELYSHYDSANATENATDRMFGAFRESGVSMQSGLIASCLHTSALRNLASPGSTIYQTVKAWKREIELLDSVGAGRRSINAGMVLGALCVLRVRNERAIPFIYAVVHDMGERNEHGSDGVDAIVRHAKGRKTTGEAEIQDMAGRFITACESWLAGNLFKQSVRPTSFAIYLQKRS